MEEYKFRKWHQGNGKYEYATLKDFVTNGWNQCEATANRNSFPKDPENPWRTDPEYLDKLIEESFMGSGGWELVAE